MTTFGHNGLTYAISHRITEMLEKEPFLSLTESERAEAAKLIAIYGIEKTSEEVRHLHKSYEQAITEGETPEMQLWRLRRAIDPGCGNYPDTGYYERLVARWREMAVATSFFQRGEMLRLVERIHNQRAELRRLYSELGEKKNEGA
jgi:hypothetical protein